MRFVATGAVKVEEGIVAEAGKALEIEAFEVKEEPVILSEEGF